MYVPASARVESANFINALAGYDKHYSTTVAYRPCTALTHYILWLSSELSAKCAVLIHYATVVLACPDHRSIASACRYLVPGPCIETTRIDWSAFPQPEAAALSISDGRKRPV